MEPKKIKVVTYEYKLPINTEITIAVISDLHERPFDKIIEILNLYDLDLILLPGDILERHDEAISNMKKAEMDCIQNVSVFWRFFCKIIKSMGLNKINEMYSSMGLGISFIKKISHICPIVMSVGNHEWYYTDEDKTLFYECGVTLIDNEFTVFPVKGNILSIGGLSSRYDLEWIEEFVNQPTIKILLCHHPELYLSKIKNRYGDKIDLAISGHAHGGQIRLFNRGVYSPGLGFFSKYSKGFYNNFLITSGIANTAFFPRINNPSEICILHIAEE